MKYKMKQTILKNLKKPNKKIIHHAGLSSISIDISSMQGIIQILLKKTEINDLLKDNDGLIINDSLFTALFIKYRRCFNSTKRNASLNKKHIPKEFLDLHTYLLSKATNDYAHTFNIQREYFLSFDQDTNKVNGISSQEALPLFPLTKEALLLLNNLLTYLQKTIFEKQKKIKGTINNISLKT